DSGTGVHVGKRRGKCRCAGRDHAEPDDDRAEAGWYGRRPSHGPLRRGLTHTLSILERVVRVPWPSPLVGTRWPLRPSIWYRAGGSMQPPTRYVRGPEGHVAYQVFGQGPRDIVFVPDHPNNIEIMWEEPAVARFFERLGTMGRVICFDKRGTGISDPVPLGAIPTIERWMDDVTTVIDAVGCERIVAFGHGDGGPIAMLFAATYPARTEALVLGDTFARLRNAPDYPDGLDERAAE